MKLILAAVALFVILPWGTFKALDRMTDTLLTPHAQMLKTVGTISAAQAASDPLAALECQGGFGSRAQPQINCQALGFEVRQ